MIIRRSQVSRYAACYVRTLISFKGAIAKELVKDFEILNNQFYDFLQQVPPESIERAAGLLFFDKISREKLTKVNGKKIGR